MTDRELLELAAKAAGIEVWPGAGVQAHVLFTRPDRADPSGKVTGVAWNTLTDDGDALRLAVKLRFVVAVRGHEIEIFSDDDGDCLKSISIPPDGSRCPLEMTRRAIGEAAAEIGKTRSD